MTWAIDERNMATKYKRCITVNTVNMVGLVRVIRHEALWSWALRALVKLCIGITQLDGNVTHELLLVTHSLLHRKAIKVNEELLTFCSEIERTRVDFP